MNTTPPLNPSLSPLPPQKKKRGCLFYGCLSVFILLVLAAVGGYYGFKYFVSNVVETYSAGTQLALPAVPTSKVDVKELEGRVDAFINGIKTGSGPKQLVLTTDQVNALIINHPDSPFKDSLRVGIKENALTGQLSYPLAAFGFPGRYFNGEGEFSVKMENGILEVSVASLTVRGVAVPEQVLSSLNEKNLAAKLYEDPKSLETMKKIEQIKLSAGQILIERR
ncbi:MAG: hypothetical protein J0M12_14355 [Deltaproteobacteria bacterium]|nr:hypothetical protein [Deltaproteobacteria bacterium]